MSICLSEILQDLLDPKLTTLQMKIHEIVKTIIVHH